MFIFIFLILAFLPWYVLSQSWIYLLTQSLSSFATSIQEETRKHTVRQPGRGRESMDYNVEDMDERERMPLLSEGRLEWTGLSH